MKLQYKVLTMALIAILLAGKCKKPTHVYLLDNYTTDTICRKAKYVYTIRKQ